MYDVVFITPNMTGNTNEECLGTLQLATILKKKGVCCDIMQFFRIGDIRTFQGFIDNMLCMIREKQPKIVSFYSRCDTYHIVLRMAQRIKEQFENIYIVLGGPQSDITAESTIKEMTWVDFVCCGEGENTVYPFFSSLLQGKPDFTVPGLVYRQNGEVVKNPRPEMVQDLDALPMLDYSLLHFTNKKDEHKNTFSIDVGRGCPFNCTFCSTNSFWGRNFRLKSPQRIVDEVKFLHENYGRVRFNFSHDMFTFNRKKVREVCSLLKTLDFPLEWGCSARLDCIDKELIDVMADAGMVGIYLGIETGSPRMQKLINKRLKLENAVETIAYLKEKGINTIASFIFGFPEETEEDISCTMALIAKLLNLQTVTIQTHLCTFHVGTELSERYASEMTPVDYYSDQTGEFAIEECRDLIQGYPEIFKHMLEYKTELRTKLRYFSEFFQLWSFMQPVYQYLSEKYSEDQLINLYYDFVKANQEVLDQLEANPVMSARKWLCLHDRFPDCFADDSCYDIIKDLYRYRQISLSDEVRNGGVTTEIFCFDPRQIGKVPLQEYTRCVAYVEWKNRKCRIVVCP